MRRRIKHNGDEWFSERAAASLLGCVVAVISRAVQNKELGKTMERSGVRYIAGKKLEIRARRVLIDWSDDEINRAWEQEGKKI